MSEIRIRDARPGDGPGIARLHRANAEHYVELIPGQFRIPDEEGLVEFLERGIEQDRENTAVLSLVAEIDGDVAGYLEAQLQPPLESARWQSGPDFAEKRLFINALGTAPEYQRRGVATRLVEAAEEWGRAAGAAVATLDTHIESPLSVPFWEQRMGYRRRAIIFRKDL